ncbi:MAG: hypothetical protein A2293_14090 [Elusimicrobia bacterium RIFOXYB2_FULL_49_7]|nr:MAG: hypothetical protein A2293_14090 [Elusimicrobia bacterium RIFOXYB2_FULL_49_7]
MVIWRIIWQITYFKEKVGIITSIASAVIWLAALEVLRVRPTGDISKNMRKRKSYGNEEAKDR